MKNTITNSNNFEKFSLLYPHYTIQEKDKTTNNFVKNSDMLKQLGLVNISMFTTEKLDLFNYVTSDVETINYRFDMFADILENQELYDILKKTREYLIDIYDARLASKAVDHSDTENSFYAINEIELYIQCVNFLHESSDKLEKSPASKGFNDLFKHIREIYESEDYKNLVNNVMEMSFRIHHLRSVTIGVNLDSQLKVTEAGVLSVNDQYFKSGSLVDKLLKLDMKDDEYTTIAPLIASGKGVEAKEKQIMDAIFLQGLNKLYSSSIRQWRGIVNNFMRDNTNFLVKLAPEIKFIINCADIMLELNRICTPLCKPELFTREEKVFDVEGLYNPSLAISLNSNDIVLNDITFDENGMIYILTGPNRGGKSVITCAIGIVQLFCQLGMLIPAKSAKISPVDCIYTHFAGNYGDAMDTLEKGRLGEECERLNTILSEVTPYSLVLLDETLSSTGSFEGSYIAAEVVEGLSMLGCRCIYSTHMHELAELVVSSGDYKKVDTLVAGMDEGKRSFKIRRTKPDGKSYAKDIAQKYGISLDKITKRAEEFQG